MWGEHFDQEVTEEGTLSRTHVVMGTEKVMTRETFVPKGSTAVSAARDRYHHADHLGSSSTETDDTGAVVELLDYYPYGTPHLQESSLDEGFPGEGATTPYKFTGKELDEETDLYYYGARYYMHGIGRFVSVDPWKGELTDPQSFNKYAYARNNPIRYTDPTGETFWDRLKGYASGIVAAVVNSGKAAIGFVKDPFGSIERSIKQVVKNVQYLGSYASSNTAEQFIADLKKGIGITIDTFNNLSDYDKGKVIGEMTGYVMEAAIAKRAFGDELYGVAQERRITPYRPDGGLWDWAVKDSVTIASGDKIHDVNRLVEQYGGKVSDWEKRTTKEFTSPAGDKFQSHYYYNNRTSQVEDVKTKFSTSNKSNLPSQT